jgi:hypothetical protein
MRGIRFRHVAAVCSFVLSGALSCPASFGHDHDDRVKTSAAKVKHVVPVWNDSQIADVAAFLQTLTDHDALSCDTSPQPSARTYPQTRIHR